MFYLRCYRDGNDFILREVFRVGGYNVSRIVFFGIGEIVLGRFELF